jgi:N-acetylglucosaminyldiphosphoundecaprenol N-acetyl-beta-D-mannosaminyltransferase
MWDMIRVVEEGIRERHKLLIANHNLHSLYLFHKHAKVREFYARAHWAYLEGMSLNALGRFYGYRLQRDQWLTNAEWIGALMALAARNGWRVFELGSSMDMAKIGLAQLRKYYPTLTTEVSDGSVESEVLINRINAFKPDLLIVGAGMPRQEVWIQENYARLDAHIILSSTSAILDYAPGVVPILPSWSGRVGLELMFRLVKTPPRLLTRCLVEPCYILLLLLVDYLRNQRRRRTGGRPIAEYNNHGERAAVLQVRGE